MEILNEFIGNKPLITAIIAWAIAQMIKVVISFILNKKINLKLIFSSGGMPSSHSAFVTSLATIIGLEYGFNSIYFSLSAAFAMVVMYDACNVRRAAGEQAKAINRIINTLIEQKFIYNEKTMKEILGHSPFQVLIGFVLGIMVGILSKYL